MSTLQQLSSPPTGNVFKYDVFLGSHITDELLEQCAELFSNNYGVWGNVLGGKPKAGHRVKLNGAKLRSQCISVPDRTVLVVCMHRETNLVGHVFATTCDYDGGVVGWVTQLVVSRGARRRYIATQLLQTLKIHPLFEKVTSVGVVSSHPATCHVLSKLSNVFITDIDTDFCRKNAHKILASTPVDYLKNPKLCGSLFEEDCSTGAVSSMNTSFYIDHTEPLEALKVYQARGKWRLGELLEGHEFLIILPLSG